MSKTHGTVIPGGSASRDAFLTLLAQAVAKGSRAGVRRLLKCAEDRIAEAELIGWTALAQSWRPQMEQAQRAYLALGGKL